jgi:rfaE bifunctional protein kinase chain/domain
LDVQRLAVILPPGQVSRKREEAMNTREEAVRDLASMDGRSILVVGDLILDHYLEGSIERISPEAPVPVVLLSPGGERSRPGGAANVAMNVASLGGKPFAAGLAGADPDGDVLLGLMVSSGIDVSGVARDPSRPTTTKTRIMARHQQVLRVDRESVAPVSGRAAESLRKAALSLLDSVQAVVFEDYDKGAIDRGLISALIPECRRRGIPVAVDPKFRNFLSYSGCNLLKANRDEVARISGIEAGSAPLAAFGEAGQKLREKLGADAVLVTLGEHGSVLVRKDSPPLTFPALAKHVFDVSGAGDTVVASMALCMAAGIPLDRAAALSNAAAAAACAEPGVYAVTPGDVLREMERAG